MSSGPPTCGPHDNLQLFASQMNLCKACSLFVAHAGILDIRFLSVDFDVLLS